MSIHKDNNFYYLLGGLLVMLLAAPAVGESFRGIMTYAFIGTLLIGVWSLSASRKTYIAGWVLVVLIVVVGVLESIWQFGYFLELTVYWLFCLLSVVFSLRRVIFSSVMNTNRIVGAICVYMLLGMFWAILYYAIYSLNPAAFNGVGPLVLESGESNKQLLFNFIYYSFVTLTTLGYGDLTPVSGIARALSYLEAITGVMYTAVLVAALVGAYASQAQEKQ